MQAKDQVAGVAGGCGPDGGVDFACYSGTSTDTTPLGSSPTGTGTYTVAPTTQATRITHRQRVRVALRSARAGPTVTLASPPPSIVFDGTTDVTYGYGNCDRAWPAYGSDSHSDIYLLFGRRYRATPLGSSPIGIGTYTVVDQLCRPDTNYFTSSHKSADHVHDHQSHSDRHAGFAAARASFMTDDRCRELGTRQRSPAWPACGPVGTPTFTYYLAALPSTTPLGSSPIGAGTYTVVANYGGDTARRP